MASDGQQLDLEQQRGVGRDHAAGAARAVAEFGRDDQAALAADADIAAGTRLTPEMFAE